MNDTGNTDKIPERNEMKRQAPNKISFDFHSPEENVRFLMCTLNKTPQNRLENDCMQMPNGKATNSLPKLGSRIFV